MVLDYAISSEKKKKSINVTTTDTQGISQVKKIEILGNSYYEIIAILNYCCTITYYAATSEHREEYSIKLSEISSLYNEIRSLSFDTSINSTNDVISKFSQPPGIYIRGATPKELAELFR